MIFMLKISTKIFYFLILCVYSLLILKVSVRAKMNLWTVKYKYKCVKRFLSYEKEFFSFFFLLCEDTKTDVSCLHTSPTHRNEKL